MLLKNLAAISDGGDLGIESLEIDFPAETEDDKILPNCQASCSLRRQRRRLDYHA